MGNLESEGTAFLSWLWWGLHDIYICQNSRSRAQYRVTITVRKSPLTHLALTTLRFSSVRVSHALWASLYKMHSTAAPKRIGMFFYPTEKMQTPNKSHRILCSKDMKRHRPFSFLVCHFFFNVSFVFCFSCRRVVVKSKFYLFRLLTGGAVHRGRRENIPNGLSSFNILPRRTFAHIAYQLRGNFR